MNMIRTGQIDSNVGWALYLLFFFLALYWIKNNNSLYTESKKNQHMKEKHLFAF